eukprot:gb/GECG01011747.1/.p1 GENE.gb/GECG01011747.1/~~gb/GECG01011747.1/.p1  ORF type:complete len:111 (+),score=6.72 gb/GECG01011747.1/:1-333(+)
MSILDTLPLMVLSTADRCSRYSQILLPGNADGLSVYILGIFPFDSLLKRDREYDVYVLKFQLFNEVWIDIPSSIASEHNAQTIVCPATSLGRGADSVIPGSDTTEQVWLV